jgi:hypothetical protein
MRYVCEWSWISSLRYTHSYCIASMAQHWGSTIQRVSSTIRQDESESGASCISACFAVAAVLRSRRPVASSLKKSSKDNGRSLILFVTGQRTITRRVEKSRT